MAVDSDAASFLIEYERRTNAHNVDAWAELIAPEATYWFTNGSHRGKDRVVAAVAHNFDVIKDEIYAITDVEWVTSAPDSAVVRYRFNWTGTQDGKPLSGSGRGTNVMIRRDNRWLMIHEHLST